MPVLVGRFSHFGATRLNLFHGCLVFRHLGWSLSFGHGWWSRCRFLHWFRLYHRSRTRSFFLLGFHFSFNSSSRLLLRALLGFALNRQAMAPPYCRGRNGNKACMKVSSAQDRNQFSIQLNEDLPLLATRGTRLLISFNVQNSLNRLSGFARVQVPFYPYFVPVNGGLWNRTFKSSRGVSSMLKE